MLVNGWLKKMLELLQLNNMRNLLVILCLTSFFIGCDSVEKIDRETVVSRHNVLISEVDTLNSLSLGNGRFAMTMDVTGLQTFPKQYQNGVPLGTQSEWGWHSFPTEKNYKIEETLLNIESHGREVPYAVQWDANTSKGEAANYIRQNPHRIHLANVGWHIERSDGSIISISDIENINQKLNVWKGELTSYFEVEGIPVEVISLVGQHNDILGVKIKSKLVEEGRIGLKINYPYPTNHFLDVASNYDVDESKRLNYTIIDSKNVSILRTLDSTQYYTTVSSSMDISESLSEYGYIIKPNTSENTWSFSVDFSEIASKIENQKFDAFQQEVHSDYQTFWNAGGMLDFGNVKDSRAKELERRMILSLYLTKINCGGNSPPQETGLTYNSWYGKPHLEMAWWHGVHFALWNRSEVLEKQMSWYLRNSEVAKQMATRQGFEGVRWQKMTDNNGGETVSSIGSYLIWQQPHIIYFSELIYREYPSKKTLEKYNKIIEQTANFMADFAYFDSELDTYILGPGVIPAQERFDPKTTFNPTYELAYWRWALENAQTWRERQGLERNQKWDAVLNGLSTLPQKNNLYLATESAPDSYENTKFMTDHPSVLGTYGMLPITDGLDKKIMQHTFDKIWIDWQWEETWGWDFPMTSMTATRLGDPEKAIDALLMPIITNTYLKNGHNYQNETLRIYLPGNGGLLTALAMLAVGTDENPNSEFPANWDVKVEGLKQMP